MRDAVFLHGYNEPVLALLHEAEPTWAGNLRIKVLLLLLWSLLPLLVLPYCCTRRSPPGRATCASRCSCCYCGHCCHILILVIALLIVVPVFLFLPLSAVCMPPRGPLSVAAPGLARTRVRCVCRLRTRSQPLVGHPQALGSPLLRRGRASGGPRGAGRDQARPTRPKRLAAVPHDPAPLPPAPLPPPLQKDTCVLSALSLNLTRKQNPKIWGAASLPSGKGA